MSAARKRETSRWLITSLARAGWGDVLGTREHHGTRAVLQGLSQRLPFGSGAGLVTVADVADAAGYGERWTRSRLQLLEAMGIIEWHRGGVLNGRPRPSFVRILHTALRDLIALARPIKGAADAARNAATRARLSGIRFLKNDGKHRRRSDHAALSADPHPLRGGSTGSKPPVVDRETVYAPDPERARVSSAGAALVRASIKPLRQR